MKQTVRLLYLLLVLGMFLPAKGQQQIREYMDLQMHPTMHMVYSFFSPGFEYFDPAHPPKLTWKHTFTNVNYANFWEDNAGARIIVTGALSPEYIKNKRKARRMILEEMAYINDFARARSEKFVVARTPEEVRYLVENTDKTIIVHSIEGAKRLVNSQTDANFWAEQGIAFMTLIHLVDDEFGGSGIRPGLVTNLINLKGWMRKKFRPKKYRGLTPKGKQAILWLANAGIMTDLTHMSEQARKDALTLMEEHKIPPLVTHELYKPMQNNPRGMEKEDLLRVYRGGGLYSPPISGESLHAYHPYPEIQQRIDTMKCFCPGSIDSYKLTYQLVQELVEGHAAELLNRPGITYEDLSENEKVDLAIGFQTDFNGWLNHSRPRYGKDGCSEALDGAQYEEIELIGMPHPGLLESNWRLLEKEGVDITPVKRASEKFLQMWEHFRANKGNF
ncbi:MAG: membrane dipeptidase [Bacteroidia bacterium]|nr:membrane dipeptidase [Bacteroidia bacterium]